MLRLFRAFRSFRVFRVFPCVTPVAIPLVVVLTLWLPTMKRVPYEDALPVIAFVFFASLSCFSCLLGVLRSWMRAALMTALAATYVLYLPEAILRSAAPGWVSAVLILLGAGITYDLARRIPREGSALLAVNRTATLILAPLLIAISAIATVRQIDLERTRPGHRELFPEFTGSAGENSPDVWHLVFDRYANSGTLRAVYGFDNRDFLDALRARGFTVKEDAFSNYQRTAHSLASTLNGAYLDSLSLPMAGRRFDWVPLYRAVTDSAALRFFRSRGYTTFFAGSWWNATRRSAYAGQNVNYRDLPQLGRLVLDQSLVGMLLSSAGLPYGNTRVDQWSRLHAQFDELGSIARRTERKYVFAHFLLPHPPYVVNPDGSYRSLEDATTSSRRDNYVGQLTYANREILTLIDRIEQAGRPAFVVVHADEGPWPLPFVGDERFIGRELVPVDWPSLADSQLREKMGILMAVRMPGRDPATCEMPDSPVNLYPTLLRNYFSGDRANLPDRSYVFESDTALYTFRDVTERLRRPKHCP